MKKILIGLSIGLLASVTSAQIPMSKYLRTYTGNATRGYFFQAPVDFTVTELQVPDELNKGSYCVALYRMKAMPPAWNGTVAVTPVFFAFVKDAHTCVKVPGIAFKKGEFCAVLGGAGLATGNLSNSYGANKATGNPSAVLGVTITAGLQRCGVQESIGPVKGISKMWSEVAGNISRIKMVVAKGASSCDYCPPSAGKAALDILGSHPPIIGKELKLEMKSGGTTNTGALMAFGLIRTNVVVPGFGRLCVGAIGGIVGFSGTAVGNTPTTAKIVSLGTIPAATPLGVKIMFQGALATAGAVIPLTNGLEIVSGR